MLNKSPSLASYLEALRSGKNLVFESLWESPKALLVSLAAKELARPILWLVASSEEENQALVDVPTFLGKPASLFPAWETLPSEKTPPSNDVVGMRYQTLAQNKGQGETSDENPVIITTLAALQQQVLSPDAFEKLSIKLKKGQTFKQDHLIQLLEEGGYQKQTLVSEKGHYALRGCIVDLYCPSSPDPWRIEFWDDDIDSLRLFDPSSQKSLESVEDIYILPAVEKPLLDNYGSCPLWDYFEKAPLIIYDDLEALEDRLVNIEQLLGKGAYPHFLRSAPFLEILKTKQSLFFAQKPLHQLTEVKQSQETLFFSFYDKDYEAQKLPLYFQHLFERFVQYQAQNHEEAFFSALEQALSEGFTVKVLSASEAEKKHFLQRLKTSQLSLELEVEPGYLSSALSIEDARLLFLPITELHQRKRLYRPTLRHTHSKQPASELADIESGQYIVHAGSGIGKFLGVETKVNHEGHSQEYLQLEYANQAKLFVPLDQSHLVSKYQGVSEASPTLHTLGSNRWRRIKEQTEKGVKLYAQKLMAHYAKRSFFEGFAYPPDTEDTLSFYDDFPYDLTEDQEKAVQAITQDLCSKKVMDRLVCGDVGYGKTEVAMRAAFKTVADGHKQVAVLVPTTILALQHYETFRDRMANFPIRIGLLSRFSGSRQIKQTLKEIEEGQVDIVIGTHRLISKDIRFKDLGLVIIDEEQRFGVKAKEHLKMTTEGVDSLTLSATPIPRTLYMSLVGARDLSSINTAPHDRLPVSVIIASAQDGLIKNAIVRELSRGGQVFAIHNYVESLSTYASHLQKLVPEAKIVLAHGQMDPKDLDKSFHAFKNGEAQILVATSIIENGIDIPNANTIIVNKAENLGLSDLYQFKGRVGRWNRKAYAYFLTTPKKALSEDAQKRLGALAEASGFGGGLKLSMRDLEIRGSGDILGTEQSGHISAIGFHLYCKLLRQTLKALERGQEDIPPTQEIRLDLPFDAKLSEDYVNALNLRMDLYQRLGEAQDPEEVSEIFEEICDRFGPLNEKATWLHHVMRVRSFAAQRQIISLSLQKTANSYAANLRFEKKGKKSNLSKSVIIPYPKSAQDFEDLVCAAIEGKNEVGELPKLKHKIRQALSKFPVKQKLK